MAFTVRVATATDLPSLTVVMDAAIEQLQVGFLSAEQIGWSRAIMGLDTQLVEDGTYFVVEEDGVVAGCGGWSRRATKYGSDHTAGRDAHLRNPATDPALVRAMYTDPAFARRGVGRLILHTCEAAAREEGFSTLELFATRSGRPLYTAYGFVAAEELLIEGGGGPVPATRMVKPVEGDDQIGGPGGPSAAGPCPIMA
jgi:GNAT superfamily N-acetyltransferase